MKNTKAFAENGTRKSRLIAEIWKQEASSPTGIECGCGEELVQVVCKTIEETRTGRQLLSETTELRCEPCGTTREA